LYLNEGLKLNPFHKIAKFFAPSEQRNMSIATIQRTQTPQPTYTNWSIKSAVKEGYKKNTWVYRSVYLKSKAAGSVPWCVVDSNGKKLDNHHLTNLLEFPNPFISKQDVFELIVSWLELSGNAYLLKSKAGKETTELWPVSPDRLHPIPTKDPMKWMEGYALDKSKTVTYQQEDIIHYKYFNPANPLLGIAPLEAAAKAVDVDNSQVDFNKSTSQNRGIIDGVFTFDRAFNDQSETDAISDKLNERHRNKRTFGVLGSNAKYIRTALTPAEMDFINSRKSNREEIFIAFGVPPVYAGVMDGATMNNYKTSELVFWFGTMLFLLDDIKDTLNFALREELKQGEKISYDVSSVPAIREALLAKAKTGKILYEMGVPFSQINKVFNFGFEEYEGWDESNPGSSSDSSVPANDSAVRSSEPVKKKIILETRADFDPAEQIEDQVKQNTPKFVDILKTQQESVFDTLSAKDWTEGNIESAISKTESLFSDIISETYIKTAQLFSTQFAIEKRAAMPTDEIANYLKQEAVILFEISNINSTTVDKLIAQVESALESGAPVNELQQAIIDTGIFDPKRALMLSRTITGTAANLGQVLGAAQSGATEKTWETASSEVRDSHKKMNGKTIPIDESFIVGGKKAMFPLDNQLPPAERVNCRCTLSFGLTED